jgi:large subunit ribosomal protein L4
MMKYQVSTLDLNSNKESSQEFESIKIMDNLKNNVFLIYNNQKKDRHVFSFTKSRSDFQSGGKKPFRQKGTGRARQGTSRSPLKVGGAVVFGPKPRRVRRKSNDRFFSSNLKQLLLLKLDSSVVFKETENVFKVKDFVGHIEPDKSYLFVMDVNSSNDIQLFSRIKNIPNIYFNTVNSIIIEDVIRAEKIIYTQSSFNGCFNQEGR